MAMSWLEVFAAGILLFVSWLYWFNSRAHSYWSKLGVPTAPGVLPLFGHSLGVLLGRESPRERNVRLYKFLKKSGRGYGGTYSLMKPHLMLLSPELVETVLIKDFNNFYNRGMNADEKLDPYSGNLVNLEDNRWRSLRVKLTPVFSSGKLRVMESTINAVGSILVEQVRKKCQDGPIEVKDLMATFTTDVICAVAFGLNVDSIRDPVNCQLSEFGKKFFKPSPLMVIRFMLRRSCPWLLRLLRWKQLSNRSQEFFIGIVKDAIKRRGETGFEGRDFLQLLLNLRKQDQENAKNLDQQEILTENMLIANCLVFFLAGFETTATTLSYCLYNMALHQDIQERLYQELKANIQVEQHGPTYDTLKSVPYLEQVINETLRMYPPAPNTARVCNKDYTIPGEDATDKQPVKIRKGVEVIVPIYSLHHDEESFPDPERFDPDRFAPENRDKIRKGSFLPFGDGPRICIGMRLAMFEIKVALAMLLLSFRIEPHPMKTMIPIVFDKRSVFTQPLGGLYLNLIPRDSQQPCP